MCGICGIVDFESRDPLRNKAEVSRMCEVLHHRGPDDQGMYSDGMCTFGNTRLAIIDLANGKQPMSNENGTIWVTFNGEIYNYLELRDELIHAGHTFRTNTDTEVLVHGIEKFGIGLLPRLNGMFAFAVWDSKKKQLTICRDRVGIKPIYYYHDRSRWAFASEIKALIQDLRTTRKVDVSIACDYLVKQDFFSNESIFEGINLLPSGSYLVVTSDESQLTQYWTPSLSSSRYPKESSGHDFGLVIREAIQSQLASEVPIGAHLSGGLDSSTIVHFARERIRGSFPTFTCSMPSTPDYDESAKALEVAGIERTESWTTTLTGGYLRENIESLVETLEEPRFSPGVILNDAVAALAKKHVTVVLTGQGGDELFGGYDRFSIAAFWHHLFWTKSRGRGRRAGSNFAYALRNLGLGVFLYDSIFYLLGPYEIGLSLVEAYNRMVLKRFLVSKYLVWMKQGRRKETVRVVRSIVTSREFRALGPIHRMIWLDIVTFLNYLLLTEDKIEMRHSLEARVPLLDNRVLDFVAQLDPDILAGTSPTKDFVRRAMRGIFPPSIVDRPKMGSPIPLKEWFRTDLRDVVTKHLLNPHLSIGHFVDSHKVGKLVEQHLSGCADNSEILWRLLVLELWHKRYVTGDVDRLAGVVESQRAIEAQAQESQKSRDRILYVYEKPASFVLGDLGILRRYAQVTEFRWQRARDIFDLIRAISHTDTVYMWYANLSAVAIGLMCKILRKNLIIVPAGSDVSEHPHGGALRRPIYRLAPAAALRLAQKVLAVSEFSMSEILSFHKDTPCELVHNGVDPSVFAPEGQKERLVLSVGYMDRNTLERKGFRLLVEVAHRMPETRFLIVGAILDEAAEELRQGAPANVEFPGFVPLGELVNLYKRAWVYVQLSRHEAFGVGVVEAMMSGCIPVLTDIPIFHEVGGDVAEFTSRDPGNVSNAIERAFARSDVKRVRNWSTSKFSIEQRRDRLRRALNL